MGISTETHTSGGAQRAPMNPAFSYYGGKQRMARNIVPLIPRHTVYVEPFCGGAAIFFAKPWPNVSNNNHYREVLNDHDLRIVNFYKQLRDNGDELSRLCKMTPFSRREHTVIARLDDGASDTEKARRWYVDIQQGFSNKSRQGWRAGVFSQNAAATYLNSSSRLLACASRMFGVYIECDDATKIIERWDSPQTFFYCDPPYVGAAQGHYSGYSLKDFQKLIDTLNSAQGSFLLSHYASEAKIPKRWERFEFASRCSAIGVVGKGRDKTKADKSRAKNGVRVEIVYRRFAKVAPRDEIQKLYDSGKFDCFTGEHFKCVDGKPVDMRGKKK